MPDTPIYINVGTEGTFEPTGNLQSVTDDINKIMQDLSGKKTLVVHFHGGLVHELDGYEIAQMMHNVYKTNDILPVTFVWETGFIETIKNNISSIHKTKLFKKLLEYVLRYASESLLGGDGRGDGGGKSITSREAQEELKKIDENKLPFEEIENSSHRDKLNLTPLLEGSISDRFLEDLTISDEKEFENIFQEEFSTQESELNDDVKKAGQLVKKEFSNEIRDFNEGKGFEWLTIARKVAAATWRVLKRYKNKTDHGFWPTVVEELIREIYILDDAAKWIWGGMKKAASDMFKPNHNNSGTKLHVGSYFLEMLDKLKSNQRDINIDLVGHSAGSIVICHMLQTALDRHPNLSFRNVIFLAPAARMELFDSVIVDNEPPPPESNEKSLYQRFRMFTMHDNDESNDQLVPYLYSRSLLYFISGVLEDEVDAPIIGMHRYWKEDSDYEGELYSKAMGFLSKYYGEPKEQRFVLSVKPGNEQPAGLYSTSMTHHDFDNDPKVQSSLQTITQELS